jgi:TATA box-binding protein binding
MDAVAQSPRIPENCLARYRGQWVKTCDFIMGATPPEPLEISDDEEEERANPNGMVNFLFGNVDNNLQLEANYLDEVRALPL